MGKQLLLVFICLLLSSCGLVDIYDYVHDETQNMRVDIVNYGSVDSEYFKDELMLVPDFRTFSPLFHTHKSKLILCSKKNRKIWLRKAVLRVEGEETETVLDLSIEVSIDKPLGETGYYTWVFLFNDSNTDYSKYKMKKNLILEIHYSEKDQGKSEIIKKTFRLRLVKTKGIAWPT